MSRFGRLHGGVAVAAAALAFVFSGVGCRRRGTNTSAPLERPERDDMPPAANAALVLVNTMVTIYNQTATGRDVGLVVGQVPCAGGGDAQLSGNTSLDELRDITSVVLDYGFGNCGVVHTVPEGRLTIYRGTLRQIGTLDAIGFVSETVTGRIEFEGTVANQSLPRRLCDISWTRTGQRSIAGFFRQIAGTICGEPFSFTPLVPGLDIDAATPGDGPANDGTVADGSADAAADGPAPPNDGGPG